MRGLSLGLALWISVVAVSDAVYGQNTDEAASLIRALCANSDAVRQFDVLIEDEEVHDVPGHSIAREMAYIRIRADRDKEWVLSATYRRNMEEEIATDKTKGPDGRIRLCGFQWDGSSGFFRELPNESERVRTYPKSELCVN